MPEGESAVLRIRLCDRSCACACEIAPAMCPRSPDGGGGATSRRRDDWEARSGDLETRSGDGEARSGDWGRQCSSVCLSVSSRSRLETVTW
eukprot:scaffold124761_cov36-Phaeocystis_antarctica.AAC.1